MTGIEFACAIFTSAAISESVPRYPGSVSKSAMGFSGSTRSNSPTGIPIGTPVSESISGESHSGSRPAKTSALKTERCAVRLIATLSPGFPSARITAWFA